MERRSPGGRVLQQGSRRDGATPCPALFEALGDATTDQWHLLLEDLTDTHVIATVWPLPPTPEQCDSIVRTWVDFMRRGGTIRVWAVAIAWVSVKILQQQMPLIGRGTQSASKQRGTRCGSVAAATLL